FLATEDVSFQLMLFHGGWQLDETSKGLDGQLVIGARAPVVRLRSARGISRGEKLEKFPSAKLALECLRMAVGFRKLLLFLVFQVRRICMSAPSLFLCYLCVQVALRCAFL